MSLWKALTENAVETDPFSEDPRLRGRTYAITFDRVWNAALALADGGLKRWTVVESDDEEGIILAESRTFWLRMVDDVRIHVTLDDNGQTRVDVASASRKGRGDLGTNARRVGRFLRALDGRLEASPAQILDATRAPNFTA